MQILGKSILSGFWATSRGPILSLLIVVILGLGAPLQASAEDSAIRKMGRGAANTGLGVLAIPGQITITARKSGPFVGATWGLVKGVGYAAATELVGVYELLTCPFETPPDYVQILSPEYPWQHFYKTPPRPKSKRRSRRR